MIEDIFDIPDENTQTEISEKVSMIVKLEKYSDKIDDDEKESREYKEYFCYPRETMRKGSDMSAFDHLVLSAICYYSSMNASKEITAYNIQLESIMSMANKSKVSKVRKKDSITKIKKSINIIARLEYVNIELSSFGGINVRIELNNGYSKINRNEYERILVGFENVGSRGSAIATYLSINDYQYKKPGDVSSFITYAASASIGYKVGISDKTVYRSLKLLEEIKVIAMYTVAIKGNIKSSMNNVISSYYHRDKLRQHVQKELYDKNGKYVFLYDTREGDSNQDG